MEQYLTQVPGAIHRSLPRPSDPRGVTIPPGLALAKPQEFVPLLPERLPRFKAGDRPIPGMERVLDKLLGMGSFGEVWLARHATLSRIPPGVLKFCFDETTTKSLQREAKLLDRLMKAGSHPGIVALRQTYLHTWPPALEYELCRGQRPGGLVPGLRRQGPAQPRRGRLLDSGPGAYHRFRPPP